MPGSRNLKAGKKTNKQFFLFCAMKLLLHNFASFFFFEQAQKFLRINVFFASFIANMSSSSTNFEMICFCGILGVQLFMSIL